MGYWWALEDCTLSNGCLWAVPRSHTRVVRRRFKRSATVSHGDIILPTKRRHKENTMKTCLNAAGWDTMELCTIAVFCLPGKQARARKTKRFLLYIRQTKQWLRSLLQEKSSFFFPHRSTENRSSSMPITPGTNRLS